MEGSTQIREYLIDVGSDMDDKSSGRMPTDDQFFLLYFIMGTYFGPDLMGEKTHKSVFQRRAEALPPYTPQKLAGSCMKTVQVERIYYYVLRKADPSLVLKLPWLRQFFHGNLSSCTKTPQFDDLFPPELHPHSMLKGEYEVINNIVFISDPKMVYIGSEYLERFKRLTRLEEVWLNRDEAMLHTSVDGKVLYNIDVQEIEYHNTSLSANGVPIQSVVEMKMKDMIFLPCHPTREEWINMVSATRRGCALTGSAAMGQIGPSIGCIDIGECEDSYLFRVSLPGVKRDEREFSCEVEDDGKVSVRGVTVTGEKRVCRFEQIFEMQSHKLCPPGHFSLSFKLPGPVDPQQFSGNFGTDGILEGIVMKPPNTKHRKTSLLP